jgi:hypothetical protein
VRHTQREGRQHKQHHTQTRGSEKDEPDHTMSHSNTNRDKKRAEKSGKGKKKTLKRRKKSEGTLGLEKRNKKENFWEPSI